MLRSISLGDQDFYNSPYLFGVNQGMSLLGHWHTTMNIRNNIDTIARRFDDMQPDIIWLHMPFWAPSGSPQQPHLNNLFKRWHQRGAKIVMHDGDVKAATRYPVDLSRMVDLAVCNHKNDRSAWKIDTMHWPYWAFNQKEIAKPRDDLRCELVFTGTMSNDATYRERTELIKNVSKRVKVKVISPNLGSPNSLMLTADVAASADSVLGFGRPEAKDWTDVRVYQYPGAGGVLIHDDAAKVLTPYKHFVPYKKGDVDTIVKAVETAKRDGNKIRQAAFEFIQEHHSSTARVTEVLKRLKLA